MLDWLDRNRERVLAVGAIVAFLLLIIVKIKLPVADFMKAAAWSDLVTIFQSKAFEDIVGDLLTGFIAAYTFYVFIDYLPRYNRDEKAKVILSTLISSHVETFLHGKMSGHARPLGDFHTLQPAEIKACMDMVDGETEVRGLLSLAYMGKWSHPKLSDSLQLAQSLGLSQFEVWMEITDCISRIKYLAESASDTGLILSLRSFVTEFEMVVMDVDPRNETGQWGIQMKYQVKKLLGLADDWYKLNRI